MKKITALSNSRYYFDFKYSVGVIQVFLDYYLPIDDPTATAGAAKFINLQLREKPYASNHRDYQNFIRIYGTHCN